MCIAIAEDENLEPFERAVYCILGGETPLNFKSNLFPDWTDRLFLQFNTIITRLYNNFLRHYLNKSRPQETVEFDWKTMTAPPIDWAESFIEGLKRREDTRADARSPFHLVQGAIIGKIYEELFESQG